MFILHTGNLKYVLRNQLKKTRKFENGIGTKYFEHCSLVSSLINNERKDREGHCVAAHLKSALNLRQINNQQHHQSNRVTVVG